MEHKKEDQTTLSALLAQDKDAVMTKLSAGREQDQALKALEAETDRLMYKAGAAQDGAKKSEVVQGMLQVVKSALPLVESVSEAEVWEKESAPESGKAVHLSPAGLICLIAGAACVIAGLIGQSIAGKVLRPGAVLWTVAGCVLLVAGGYLSGRGRKEKEPAARQARTKQVFLVDPAKLWHILQGIILSADHSLERIQESDPSGHEDSGSRLSTPKAMQKDDLQFFCDLLENAYARRRRDPSDETLQEQVESIRYYLHSKGIETEDYSVRSASWFEMLPAGGQAVTIRPALVKDGVVIRRGLASA